MKLLPKLFLAWTSIKLSNSLPIEDKPEFTPWPIDKRGFIPEDIFSSARFGAKFAVEDDTCRGHLPGEDGKCWTMQDFTKFLANRADKTKECTAPCLFYTKGLSGAAERKGKFVLRAALDTTATEGPRKYQTIWDLHDKKFYPNKDNWDETPETKCIYEDWEKTDAERKINGCQRLYFMAMSKAMAMECTGEVFVMTSTDLNNNQDVPEDGIWWEVEFPTLIDGNRPQDKKVTKITYIQVPELEDGEYETLTPEQRSTAPKEDGRGDYWPTGHGADQLEAKNKAGQAQRDLSGTLDRSSSTEGINSTTFSPSRYMYHGEVEKRASGDDPQILELGDEGYPFYYSIDDMVKWYGDVGW